MQTFRLTGYGRPARSVSTGSASVSISSGFSTSCAVTAASPPAWSPPGIDDKLLLAVGPGPAASFELALLPEAPFSPPPPPSPLPPSLAPKLSAPLLPSLLPACAGSWGSDTPDVICLKIHTLVQATALLDGVESTPSNTTDAVRAVLSDMSPESGPEIVGLCN